MNRTNLLRLIALAGALASAAHAADERERIRAERAAAEAAYESQVRDCRSQFAVTACVDRAKAQRRTVLRQLSRQESVLDDAERRQRAAQRVQEIQEKSAQADAASSAASGGVNKPPADMVVRTPRADRPASAAAVAPPRPHAPIATGPDASQQARNRLDYERRQREAAEHQKAAQQREDARQKEGKAVPGLPPTPAIPQ